MRDTARRHLRAPTLVTEHAREALTQRCFVERVMPELKRWDAEPAAAARGVAAGS